MSNHAPAPWTARTTRGREYVECIIYDARDCRVAIIEDDSTLEPIEANVSLITAAPTMYSALQVVLAWASNQNSYDTSTVIARVIDALREAGMDPKDLDSAAIAIMGGAAGIGRKPC